MLMHHATALEEASVSLNISAVGNRPIDAMLQSAGALDTHQRESDSISETLATVQTLGKIQGALSEANATGQGISKGAAQALSAAVEHLVSRLPVRPQAFFAMESFTGRAGNRQATRVALENIGDFISKALFAVLAWLKKIMTFLFDTLQSVSDGAERVGALATAVQEKAKGAAGKNLKSSSDGIGDSALVAFFYASTGLIKASEVLGRYTTYAEKFNKGFAKNLLLNSATKVDKVLKSVERGASKDAALDAADGVINSFKQTAFAEFKAADVKEKLGVHVDILQYALPFGQKHLKVVLSKENDKYTSMKASMEPDESPAKVDPGDKLEVLTSQQILDIAKAVEQEMLFGFFKDYPGHKRELAKIQSVIEKGCSDITIKQQSTEKSSVSPVPFSVNFVKEITASIVTLIVRVNSYDVTMNNHLLSYCKRSLSHYE